MNLKKKKKGFTLIELMAVIAIISILAAVLVPTVNGYIKRAKKTAVVSQISNLVTAIETYNATATEPIDITDDEETAETVKTQLKKAGLIEEDDKSYNKIDGTSGEVVTIPQAFQINRDQESVNHIQVETDGSFAGYNN